MALVYKTGDLVIAPETILIHGCNAQGVMGSGVAKAIRTKYPSAYDAYRRVYESSGLNLGEVIWRWIDYPIPNHTGLRVIGNAITQKFYGRSGQQFVDYDAITVAFQQVVKKIDDNRDQFPDDGPYVAIPKIGAGLGGGDWNTISQIIENVMGRYKVVVYTL